MNVRVDKKESIWKEGRNGKKGAKRIGFWRKRGKIREEKHFFCFLHSLCEEGRRTGWMVKLEIVSYFSFFLNLNNK